MPAVKTRAPSRRNVQRAVGQGVSYRRMGMYATALGAASLLLWFYLHGEALRLAAFQKFETVTARLGFRLEDVTVEGRLHTDKNQILTLLNLKRGVPLVSLDMEEAKRRLQTLPWVKAVRVERHLPSTLMIRFAEKNPQSLWQNKGKTYLVDRDGELVETKEAYKYKELPVITGLRAPEYVGGLFALLIKFPKLKARVTGATHLRATRWNIRLDNRVDVKLPEVGAEKALAYLLELEHHQLMKQKIMSIDMRFPGQLILRLTPEAAQQQKTKGKDV